MNEKLANALLMLLHLAGALVSLWLLRTHIGLVLGESDLTGNCSVLGLAAGGHGCEAVALSPFSNVWIFPLAGIALGYYLAQLVLLFWALMSPQTRYEPLYTSLNLTTLALLVTLCMAFLSFFVVKSFCIGCATLWGVNLLIWILTPYRLGIPFGKGITANFETLRPQAMQLDKARVRKAFIVAAVSVFVIAGGAAGVLASEKAKYSAGGMENAVMRFKNAPQMFLPAEALEGDRAKGAALADAKIIVVKFSDFQCPACKRAAQFFKPFFLRHKNEVRFVYRHYPLDGACNAYSQGPHYMACATATASICAAKQGKFYEFHDAVFDGQENLTPAFIRETVEKLGLDLDKFKLCQESQETKDELQRDITWGESISIRSTPTFIVNGRKIEGGFTPEQWEEIFNLVKQGK